MTNTKSSAQLPFGSVGFHITSALPLQTLRGIGMHHITSHDYHWDNRVRKNSYVLLQYTISGKGSFQTPDHTYPQQAGDLFSTTFINPVDLLSTWKHPVLYLNR